MIKAVIHFKNMNGYNVIYETDKRNWTKSYSEKRVPKTALDFIKKDNLKIYESDFSIMYKLEG